MSNNKSVRTACHAGSWYNDSGNALNAELTKYIDAVNPVGNVYPIEGCKAVIAPHAGYAYSGPTAAWAYKSIDTSTIKRVFILGPSHHYYLRGCALSSFQHYATPIGNLPLDLETIAALSATTKFEMMSADVDEAEHSIEMHLPYVRKIFEGLDIKIVPILVGTMAKDTESLFGALLAPYLAREDTFCVVSSDFCHWGTRFSYTYYYPGADEAQAIHLSRSVMAVANYPISRSISRIDHEGMDVLTVSPLTAGDAHNRFSKYLERTGNTICGRHAIGVMLGALEHLEATRGLSPVVKWVRYAQSSECGSIRDSSVSYASAWIRF